MDLTKAQEKYQQCMQAVEQDEPVLGLVMEYIICCEKLIEQSRQEVLAALRRMRWDGSF